MRYRVILQNSLNPNLDSVKNGVKTVNVFFQLLKKSKEGN